MNTRYNFITDYADYTDFRDYSTQKIISPVITLITLIFMNTWGTNFQYCVIKNDDRWLRWLQWFTQDYIKNNFIIDYADCTDALITLTKLATLIFSCIWKIISSLTTLTTLLWNTIIDNTFITDYADIQKRKIVITDYVDYPVPHITVTSPGTSV